MGIPCDLLQRHEDPVLDPLVAAVPNRGGRAGAVRDRFIGAAEPQDLDQLLEDDPVADPGPVTVQRVSGIIDRRSGSSAANWFHSGSAAMLGWQTQGLS
jgi:hypothetical protein